MKPPLFGKSFQEILQIVKDLSLPSFTAKQISDWLYKKKAASFDEMTNISLKNRELLKEHYAIGLNAPVAVHTSGDQTKKYLFTALEDKYVEAAFIPDRDRATLCISSQVGCRMGCSFCMTARQPMRGNLSTTDILNQFQSLPEHDALTNIVYMGMGEPFDNLTEVMKSLDILTADYGYAWAPKRITVSTIGIFPSVRHFMENSRCHLAVSLHHPDPAERRKLMPIENKYPIQQIIHLLKTYDLNRQRRISFEYIMLSGVNDTPQQVKEMTKLLSGLKCRVNLIPFHPIPESPFIPSKESVIRQFAEALNKKNILTTIRQSRGFDIDAACGMLSTARNQ